MQCPTIFENEELTVLKCSDGTTIAATYNRYSYATEKRSALDLWGAHVAALVLSGGAVMEPPEKPRPVLYQRPHRGNSPIGGKSAIFQEGKIARGLQI
jgi:hypothetical protein